MKDNKVLVELLDKELKKKKMVEIPNDEDEDLADDISDVAEREEFEAEQGRSDMENPIVKAFEVVGGEKAGKYKDGMVEPEEEEDPEFYPESNETDMRAKDTAPEMEEDGEVEGEENEEEDEHKKETELIKKLLANKK